MQKQQKNYRYSSHQIIDLSKLEGDERRNEFNKAFTSKYKSNDQEWKKVNYILDFISEFDSLNHKYEDTITNSDRLSLLYYIFHKVIYSDFSGILLLYVNKYKFQANLILSHMIETFIYALFADLITNFNGNFEHLLSKELKNKDHRTMIKWDNKKFPNIKERLKEIEKLNNINGDIYSQFFSKATYDDLEILFSIPTCEDCFKNLKNSDLKFYTNNLTKNMLKENRESQRGIFLTNFFTKCVFCSKNVQCSCYTIGNPDFCCMIELLKKTYKEFKTKFNALNQMYDYLSKHFIHFSSHVDPLRTRNLEINSGEKRINIWGMEGLESLVEILKPLIQYYFNKIEEIK